MPKCVFRAATLSLLVLLSASAASAAVVRAGGTAIAIAGYVRGNAVAYDPINKVYLVVGAYGGLRGRFVTAAGVAIGTAFTINANPAGFAHFPRVAFSPDADGGAGGFLVTWHEGAPSVRCRMVSYGKGGPYGPDTQLTGDTSFWEVGPAVAYSTGSQEFLVTWRGMAGAGVVANDIRAVRVSNAATALGPVFNVTADVDYQDNPSVAYNPAADEFLVVYAGFNDPGNFAYVDAKRVKAGTGALLNAATRLTAATGTYITDASYNPVTGKYLASWYAVPGGSLGRIVNADGTASGNVITLSTRWRSTDALSIAYNQRAQTFFLVSHGTTVEDGGVELDGNGTPIDNGFVVTQAGGLKGNYHPRVAASTDDPLWLMSTANDFTSTMTQLLSGDAASGAPTPPPPPPSAPTPPPTPTPTPVSAPLMNVDYPGNATVPGEGFQISGWAIDRGVNAGTGSDAIHVWAWPVSGAPPIFLGAANYGISRPDVGAFYGANFTNSGFSLVAGLPAGTYDLAVNARSTLTGTFAAVQLRRITVTAPVSRPFMWIDLPVANQNTSQNLLVAGWALDAGSALSSGVDAIHVWAYPASGAAPIFLGAATYGISRPDVAAAFGGARYTPSGFRLATTAPPGQYTLVVFARSTLSGTFNASAVAITVR